MVWGCDETACTAQLHSHSRVFPRQQRSDSALHRTHGCKPPYLTTDFHSDQCTQHTHKSQHTHITTKSAARRGAPSNETGRLAPIPHLPQTRDVQPTDYRSPEPPSPHLNPPAPHPHPPDPCRIPLPRAPPVEPACHPHPLYNSALQQLISCDILLARTPRARSTSKHGA